MRNTVRIIGGEWRSRRLSVPEVPGLRPSGDRVRETLFNWLQAHLAGAVCADLYAGTGALGFEAASRGAGHVTLVEKDPAAARQLQRNAEWLGAKQVVVFEGDALYWVGHRQPESLDVVFVDPPFADRAHRDVLDRLSQTRCLRPGGMVYVESPAGSPPPEAPEGWAVHREKVLGEVRMQVFIVHPSR